MRNKKIIIALLSLLAVILIAAVTTIGIMMVQDNQTVKKYEETINIAQKYLSESDYDNAIIKFKEAIEIDEKAALAYANLGVIYINLNNMEEALRIFELGYQKTGDSTILYLINTYFPNNTLPEQEAETREIKEIENLTMNRTIIGQIASYSCENYSKQYGSPTIKTDGIRYTLTYGNINAEFIYYNVGNERVIDEVLSKPYENKMPMEIKLKDLSLVFYGMESSISYAQLQKMSLSNLKCQTINDTPYVTFQFSGCDFKIKSNENGDILSLDAENTIKPINRQDSEGDKYVLRGTVINAVTGAGVENAKIYVRALGNKTGTVIDETQSEIDGSYQIELDAGSYTIQVVKEEFVEEFFDVTVKEVDFTQENFTISPALAEGEVRIVLTWGSTPNDLDSYLDGRTDNGENVNVNFRNKTCNAAELDVDETRGYGPETTTIKNINGKYTFTVKDFGRTGTMSASGAEVKVYLPGSSQPIVYSIGSGMNNEWIVFEIDHGQIREINRAGD